MVSAQDLDTIRQRLSADGAKAMQDLAARLDIEFHPESGESLELVDIEDDTYYVDLDAPPPAHAGDASLASEQDPHEPPALTPKCMACGSHDVARAVRAIVLTRVQNVTQSPDGALAPLNTAETEVDWDSAEQVDFPWVCMTCRSELTDVDIETASSSSAEGDANTAS